VLEPQVIEMRELRQSGAKLRELAERYGVTISAVSMICNRKVWKDI
jgi:DNA-binding MarR family transcriptional regulator